MSPAFVVEGHLQPVVLTAIKTGKLAPSLLACVLKPFRAPPPSCLAGAPPLSKLALGITGQDAFGHAVKQSAEKSVVLLKSLCWHIELSLLRLHLNSLDPEPWPLCRRSALLIC